MVIAVTAVIFLMPMHRSYYYILSLEYALADRILRSAGAHLGRGKPLRLSHHNDPLLPL